MPFAVTIGNTFGNQATTDAAGLAPFANVTVGTAVPNAYTTATVTLSAAANGVLSNPGIGNLGAGGASYTVSGTAADVQAALRVLVFTPTDHEVPVGTSVTTGFTLAVSDAYGSASDAITSVVATALDTPPGHHRHYRVPDAGLDPRLTVSIHYREHSAVRLHYAGRPRRGRHARPPPSRSPS